MGFGRGPGRRSLAEADLEPVPPERRGRTVRRIGGFFRPYRWQVVLVVVSIMATSLLGVVNPFLLRAVLDVAIPDEDLFLLNVLVLAMIVVPITSGLIGVGQTYVNNRVGQAVMEDLIILNPTFRSQYDDIVRDLFTGPLSPAILGAAPFALTKVRFMFANCQG